MEKVITIIFGEANEFVSKEFSSEQALKTIADLKEKDLYIDDNFIEDHSSVTVEILKNASNILVQSQLIGA